MCERSGLRVVGLLVVLILGAASLLAPREAAAAPHAPAPAQVVPGQAPAPPELPLPDPPITAGYGAWLQGSLGSVRDLALAGVPPGFALGSGVYASWCLEGERLGSPSLVKLYSSYGPALPADVAALPWPQINYLINHKQGDLRDVQNAIWMLTGVPTTEFPVTRTALAMVAEASRNPGFVPGPGQLVAVIAYSDGLQGNLQGFQELFFELRLPWNIVTPTPTSLTATTTAVTATPTLSTGTPTPTSPGGTATPTPTGTSGTTILVTVTPSPRTATPVSLLPYPYPLPPPATGFTFYFFNWRPPGWGWLWLLCCLPLLLLPLLPLLLLGRRSIDRVVERFTSREEVRIVKDERDRDRDYDRERERDRERDATIIAVHRNTTRQLLSDVERLQTALRERTVVAERIAEVERDTRTRQSEVRTALYTARHQREMAEELRLRLERLLTRRDYPRGRRGEVELWLRELERALTLLWRWQTRLYESDSDLAVLYTLLVARRGSLRDDELRRLTAAFESLELRLRVLLRRLETGEIKLGSGGYELVVQLIEQIRLRLERLRREVGHGATLVEDRLLIERIVAALIASRQMSAGMWTELLRLRRELKTLRLRLIEAEEWRGALSIENVERVATGVQPAAERRVVRQITRRVETGHLAPLISWSLVRAEGGRGRWRAVLTVRNSHHEVVFVGVRVEILVTVRALEEAPRGVTVEFGDVAYSERWLTREVALAGLVAERSEFAVCVLGTWVIAPSTNGAERHEVIDVEEG